MTNGTTKAGNVKDEVSPKNSQEQGQPSANPVQEEEQPSAGPVQEEEEPSAGPIQEEEQPSTGSVQEQGQPSAGPVQEEEQPSAGPVQEEEQPSAGPVQEEEQPSACIIEEEEKPSTSSVQEEEQPSAGPVQEEEQPSAGPLQEEEQPSAGPVQEEEQPSAGLVQEEEQPSGGPVQEKEQPSAGPVQEEEQPSTGSVQGGKDDEQPSAGSVQEEEQPSASPVQEEKQPSTGSVQGGKEEKQPSIGPDQEEKPPAGPVQEVEQPTAGPVQGSKEEEQPAAGSVQGGQEEEQPSTGSVQGGNIEEQLSAGSVKDNEQLSAGPFQEEEQPSASPVQGGKQEEQPSATPVQGGHEEKEPSAGPNQEKEQLSASSVQRILKLLNSILQSVGPNTERLSSLHLNQTGYSEETLQLFSLALDDNTLDAKVCMYILDLDSEDEATDANGRTPLIKAAQCGNLVALKVFLIKENASLERKDHTGQTPLAWATKCGHLDVVKFLVENGADVNSADNEKMTPLHHAASSSHRDVVKLLVAKGADVNFADKEGNTVIHCSIAAGDWGLVRYLAGRGADVLMTDGDGQSAIQLAALSAQWQVVQDMIRRGAPISGLTPEQKNRLLKHVIGEHNSECRQFYNVIRLGQTKLFRMLVDSKAKCAHVHCGGPCEVMTSVERAIAEAYEELKIKNVFLTREMESQVQEVILRSRFFADKNDSHTRVILFSLEDVLARIDMICSHVKELNDLYSGYENKGVDDKFFFDIRTVAENIRIIKRQLKPTYDRLPWEEIEFCLSTYILMHCPPTGNGSFFNVILDYKKVVRYLVLFSEELYRQKLLLTKTDVGGKFPKKQNPGLSARNNIKNSVLSKNQSFQNLYDDHEQIRNIKSLERIEYYAKLAISVNLAETKDVGMLVIERSLQVIGESMKNTIESPNMSDDIHEKLILSAPKKVKELVTSLRDSLSHAVSLRNKVRLERTGIEFFMSVQNDLEKIGVEVQNILYYTRMDAIKVFSRRFVKCKSLLEARYLATYIELVDFDQMTSYQVTEKKTMQKIKKTVNKLRRAIKDLTTDEEANLDKINEAVDLVFSRLKNRRTDYNNMTNVIRGLGNRISNADNVDMVRMLFDQLISTSQFETNDDDDILMLVTKIFHSVRDRSMPGDSSHALQLCYKIYNQVKFDVKRVMGIDKLKAKLEGMVHLPKDSTDAKISAAFDIIEMSLATDEQRATFRRELNKRQLSYTSKSNFKTLLDSLKSGSLKHNDPETIQIYTDCFQHLDVNKRKKQMLHRHFQSQQWEECKRVIESLRDNYEIFVNTVKKSIDVAECQDLSKLLKDFFRAVFKGSLLLAELFAGIDTIYKNDNKQFETMFEERLLMLSGIIKDNPDLDFLVNWDTDKVLQAGVEMLVLDLLEILDTMSFFGDNNLFLDRYAPILMGKTLRNYLAHGDCLVSSMLFDPSIALRNSAALLLEKGVDLIRNGRWLVSCQVEHDPSSLTSRHSKGMQTMLVQNKMFQMSKDCEVHDVENCILAGSDEHGRDFEGWTGLHYAAMGDNLEVFTFYLEHNVDIKLRSYKGLTVLQLAAIYGSTNTVEHLLERNLLPVEYGEENGTTPLFHAALKGRSDVVQILLDYGANIENTDSMGMTAMHFAAKNGHLDVVQVLLNKKANVHALCKNNLTPLDYAICNKSCEISELLMSKGAAADATSTHSPLLEHAVLSAQSDVVQTLLEMGIGADELRREDCTALHMASAFGKTDTVIRLLASGAHVDARDDNCCTPLHIAVALHHPEVAQVLLNGGADPNARNNELETPFHFACSNGNQDIVNLLLRSGANIEGTTEGLWTPLMFAVIKNHADIVAILLREGADVKAVTVTKNTALHWAAHSGLKEVTAMLLDSGADVNARNDYSLTPLLQAAMNKHLDTVKLFLDHEESINASGTDITSILNAAVWSGNEDLVREVVSKCALLDNLALNAAAELGNKNIVQTLLSIGCGDQQGEVMGPLHLAAKNGHVDVLNALIDSGLPVDTLTIHGDTPLHTAAMNGETESVTVLLARGADIKTPIGKDHELTALHLAAFSGNVNTVEVLLANGANVNSCGVSLLTPLMLAVLYKRLSIASILLERGANINCRTISGNTPLHIAVKRDYKEIINLLLNKGADTNIQDNEGRTSLHFSSIVGNKHTVIKLLEKGADVNITNQFQRSALTFATANGHEEVVNILLAFGAELNIAEELCRNPPHSTARDIVTLPRNRLIIDCVDDKGCTPLMYAAHNGLQSILEKLLHERADVGLPDKKGMTALHYTSYTGSVECLEILLNHGANIEARDNNDWTPLFYAVRHGRKQIVEKLLELGANFNSTDKIGMSAVDYARQLNNEDILHSIVKKKVQIEGIGTEVINELHVAASKGQLDIVSALIASETAVDVRDLTGWTPLMYAARQGRTGVMRLLVAAGADVKATNGDGNTALDLATREGHGGCVDMLRLQQECGAIALRDAAGEGWDDVVKALLASGASANAPDVNDVVPLHLAAFHGHAQVIRTLLTHGACIEARTNRCYSPLHMATLADHKETVTTLLQHGADVRARTDDRSTPLNIAARNCCIDIVQELLNHEAPVNAVDVNNQMALHLAAKAGNIDICRALLEHGVMVNGQLEDQEVTSKVKQQVYSENGAPGDGTPASPLHLAVEGGHRDVVELLLENGACVRPRNAEGKTALALALDKCSQEVVDIETYQEIAALLLSVTF